MAGLARVNGVGACALSLAYVCTTELLMDFASDEGLFAWGMVIYSYTHRILIWFGCIHREHKGHCTIIGETRDE